MVCTPAANHLWGYRESKTVCVRSHPYYHDTLHTCRVRETERRRHCGNEGSIRVVAECRRKHDMMTGNCDGIN